jgi:hypothetical protein
VNGPTLWFDENVEYHGEMRAVFENENILGGDATVTFDEYGMALVEAVKVKPAPQGRCVHVTVTTADGCLSSIDSGNIYVDVSEGVMRIRLVRAQFDTVPEQGAKYWVVSLVNYTGTFEPPFPPMAEHVLRLAPPPVPQDYEEAALACFNDQITAFFYGGRPGFIEPLPDYRKRLHMLEKREVQAMVTAVMVGETGEHGTGFEDVKGWFPHDFLMLLSLASGTEVGGGCIEFRNKDGGLVRRLHIPFERLGYSKGHGIMDSVPFFRGTQQLISCAARSPHLGETFLHVTLRHLVKASRYATSLDDRCAHLIRAIDGLIGHYGIGEMDLLKRLEPAQKTKVKDAINRAARDIKILAASASTPMQCDAMVRIAERAQSASYTVDDKFGDAFCKLLEKFGLHDYPIADAYFRAHPLNGNDSFRKVLSYLRGATIHNGYFDIGGTLTVETILTIMHHLFDIVTRIVLKILDYPWSYGTRLGGSDYRLIGSGMADWVQTTSKPADLGYI